MGDPDVRLLIFIVLAVGLGGAVWYYRDDILPALDEPLVLLPEAVVEETPAEIVPKYPIETSNPKTSPDRNLVPLPPLDDSDSYFLLALVDVFGSDIAQVLVNEALIDKFVATVDNLTRSHVAEKIRPVGRLSESFVADVSGDSFYLSADNYKRYDLLVGLIAGASLDDVAATYRRFYPLMQKSYQRLGYPDAYFNDRVVEVIDQLLATPEPEGPIRL
jgi:hypothetical protein